VSDTVFKLNRVGSIALVTIDNGEDYRKPTTLGRSAFESAIAVLDELERGDWILEPARGEDAFTERPVELWRGVLERKGGSYALVARMPPDPSVN